MGQESRAWLIWLPLPGSPVTGCNEGVWGAVTCETSTKRRSVSELTRVVFGRIQFLQGCWPEVSLSSLSGRPLHRAAGFYHSELARESQKKACKMEAIISSQPNFRSNSHHFCCIIFIRSELLGPVCTQGEGIPQRCDYQEAGIIGVILEAACHIYPPRIFRNLNKACFVHQVFDKNIEKEVFMTECCGMIFTSQIDSRPLTNTMNIVGCIPVNSQLWCDLTILSSYPWRSQGTF